MKKIWKTFGIIASVLLITLLFSVLVNTQYVANLHFINPEDYPIVGAWIPYYLFWGSILFIILALLAILVVLFFPKSKTQINLRHSDDQLLLTDKAVEGLVKASIQKFDFINDSKIKVKLRKSKIRIDIFGEVKTKSNAVQKANQLAESVKADIQNFLGVKDAVELKVIFNNIDKKTEASKSRVM